MIYLSTGGFKNKTAYDVCKYFKSANINEIELSGGRPQDNLLESLKKLKDTTKFMVHNYFPPPDEPFVFNLASLDKSVAKKSFDHAVKAMHWSFKLGNPVYSFHAGFLLDPKVFELGSKVPKRELYNKTDCLYSFIDQLNKLSLIGQDLGVSLMVENNVLSYRNFLEFGGNPFLMATSEECRYVMEQTPKNINLLIDVAHLKVSSNSLRFSKEEFLSNCSPWILGYHLSDNDGKSDSNQQIREDSWFWPYLKRNLEYYTLEVYEDDLELLKNQISLVKLKLNSNE